MPPASHLAPLLYVAVGAAAGCWLALRARRKPAAHQPLTLADLPPSPVPLLRRWLALEPPPAFVVLATSSPSEGATARHVVLQALGDDGALVVGTATRSLKMRQIADDPRAELVARWGHLQVRARGRARLGDAAESDASWGRLPDGARLGLPALEQGEPVDDGAWADIARRVDGARRRAGSPPPARPESFSALILEPETFEFYSGGHENYLNDRWLYVKRAGAWEKLRLQP